MPSATVKSSGQTTIPAEVRVSLGIEVGTRVEFVEIEKGKYALVAATHSVQALKGMLRKPVSSIGIGDMNKAIANDGVRAKKHTRAN